MAAGGVECVDVAVQDPGKIGPDWHPVRHTAATEFSRLRSWPFSQPAFRPRRRLGAVDHDSGRTRDSFYAASQLQRQRLSVVT